MVFPAVPQHEHVIVGRQADQHGAQEKISRQIERSLRLGGARVESLEHALGSFLRPVWSRDHQRPAAFSELAVEDQPGKTGEMVTVKVGERDAPDRRRIDVGLQFLQLAQRDPLRGITPGPQLLDIFSLRRAKPSSVSILRAAAPSSISFLKPRHEHEPASK